MWYGAYRMPTFFLGLGVRFLFLVLALLMLIRLGVETARRDLDCSLGRCSRTDDGPTGVGQ